MLQLLNIHGSSVAGTESFKVVMDDNQTVSSGTFTLVNYDKEIFDNGGNYDTSNKKFTAPSTGTYQFNINLSFATDGSYGLDNVMLHLAKNGTRPIANQFLYLHHLLILEVALLIQAVLVVLF